MDIVERLRVYIQFEDPKQFKNHIVWMAADEIERLRDVMETVADVLYDKGDYECWAALRNALWQQGEKK